MQMFNLPADFQQDFSKNRKHSSYLGELPIIDILVEALGAENQISIKIKKCFLRNLLDFAKHEI